MVVVGSPLVLLNIEEHMVKLYGDKGKCWSRYLKSCLDNDTLIIPSFVAEPHQSTSVKFKEVLTFKLIHATVPQTFQSSRRNSDDSGYSSLSSASSTLSLESSISDDFWPVSEVEKCIQLSSNQFYDTSYFLDTKRYIHQKKLSNKVS